MPTLDGVIDPKKRPALWTSDMTADDYDLQRVGWMDKPWEFTITLDQGFGRFDTNLPGNFNQVILTTPILARKPSGLYSNT